MKTFTKKTKIKKFCFLKFLLIESKLMNFFDYIILVVCTKKNRLKRYIKKWRKKKMFYLLDKNQIPAKKKLNIVII